MKIAHVLPVLSVLVVGAGSSRAASSVTVSDADDLLRAASSLIDAELVLPSAELPFAELPSADVPSGEEVSSGGFAQSGLGARTTANMAPEGTRSSGVWVNPALRGIGVGLQVGTPTSLTFKFSRLGNADVVLGVGAGVDFRNFGTFGLSIHADYLFTVATLVRSADFSLDAYIGPGLWFTLFDRGYGYIGGFYYVGVSFFSVGVRVPLGLNLRFTSAPMEVYLELDPAVFVFPGVGGFVGASLGFRWFF